MIYTGVGRKMTDDSLEKMLDDAEILIKAADKIEILEEIIAEYVDYFLLPEDKREVAEDCVKAWRARKGG